MDIDLKEQQIIRDLGDGLILRRATHSDVEALVEFNTLYFTEDEVERGMLAAWTRDLIEKHHPTFSVGDFTIVEDSTEGKIVSSMNIISQTWSYEGIQFGVGRPELVSTHPDYRNKGLVRAQFEVVHEWSAKRGEKVQAITGIPYYYRLYGYEMGLALGGGRAGFKPQIPVLKEDESEPYQIRPAREADLGLINELYTQGAERSMIHCIWNEDLWRYELNAKSEKNINRIAMNIIETAEGEPIGILGHPPSTWGPMMPATVFELKPGYSWASVTPTVIRFLQKTGEKILDGNQKHKLEAFGFWFGMEHPVYKVLDDRTPRIRKPYAWYIRVPDLPDFLRHITPVLESRLAASPISGHTGELKLTFYRNGLRLVFETGRLATVESHRPHPVGHSGDAAFPALTFLQLLFGYRSLDELKYAFADCWTNNDDTTALLNALFPKKASNVIPVS
jgi:hypothetical protein